jgi:TspO/MBR family
VCAHVPLRGGGFRGGCRGRSSDAPLSRRLVSGSPQAELDSAAASASVDRPAGLLYGPYLAWATYAAALNVEIWRLNRS